MIEPTRNGSRRHVDGNRRSNEDRRRRAHPRERCGGQPRRGDALRRASVNGPAPVNANLTQQVTITFTGPGAFNVTGTGTGNPSGVAYTSGGNITYNGWTAQISGTPTVGDTFTIQPNATGSSATTAMRC